MYLLTIFFLFLVLNEELSQISMNYIYLASIFEPICSFVKDLE
jgi:hypothetical protein